MRRLRTLTYVLAAILLTSCGSDSATNPSDNTLSGTFVLHYVNDGLLPFSIEDAGVVYTVGGGWIGFQPNGTFDQSKTVTVTQAGTSSGPATFILSGTFVYTASTHAVSLRTSDGEQITGTVVNDTMTLQDGGDTYVFYRQS